MAGHASSPAPMKLATYRDGSRDGQLVVVSSDLAQAHYATSIATRLQAVLDDWNFLSPQLQDLYATLNQGKARHAFAFEPRRCLAPLPRAYRWVRGGERLVHGGGDAFAGATDTLRLAAPAQADAWQPAIVAATGDLVADALPEQALESVRLLMLAAWWPPQDPAADSDDALPPVFGPVAVTPDELGPAWTGSTLKLALHGAAADPTPLPAFGAPIARLARARALRAGTLLGLALGNATAPEPGQALCVQAWAVDGSSVFGAIEATIADGG